MVTVISEVNAVVTVTEGQPIRFVYVGFPDAVSSADLMGLQTRVTRIAGKLLNASQNGGLELRLFLVQPFLKALGKNQFDSHVWRCRRFS